MTRPAQNTANTIAAIPPRLTEATMRAPSRPSSRTSRRIALDRSGARIIARWLRRSRRAVAHLLPLAGGFVVAASLEPGRPVRLLDVVAGVVVGVLVALAVAEPLQRRVPDLL